MCFCLGSVSQGTATPRSTTASDASHHWGVFPGAVALIYATTPWSTVTSGACHSWGLLPVYSPRSLSMETSHFDAFSYLPESHHLQLSEIIVYGIIGRILRVLQPFLCLFLLSHHIGYSFANS
jgi:hypothetical protein